MTQRKAYVNENNRLKLLPSTDSTSADVTTIAKVASGAIATLNVVRETSATQVSTCDAATEAHGDSVLGVSTSGVADTVSLELVSSGILTNGGWSWTPGGLIFAGLAGALTQTVPTLDGGYAFSKVMGVALSATAMRVRPETTYYF